MTQHDDERPTRSAVAFAAPADGPASQRVERLLVVVGYDGSDAAGRAVDAARRLIAGRIGIIEVVFVAHPAMGSELSAQAQSELLKGFDTAEAQYAKEIQDRFDGIEGRWRFHRRDGLIAHELTAFADELSRDYGGDATVIIVVGRAQQAYHHMVGSVPVALVRHARYPVVVVP